MEPMKWLDTIYSHWYDLRRRAGGVKVRTQTLIIDSMIVLKSNYDQDFCVDDIIFTKEKENPQLLITIRYSSSLKNVFFIICKVKDFEDDGNIIIE